MPSKIYDLTGAVFGPITVIKLDHFDPVQGRNFWLIRCKCGTESVRPANGFRKKAPPCKGCELAKLREAGFTTPDWMMALGFDETFTHRLFSKCKEGPAPAHRPELGPCLNWNGALTSRGRGSIRMVSTGKSIPISPHRASYIYHSGKPIPEDPEHDCVLHKCDNPICIRFEHLFLGNDLINQRDMIAKGRDRHPAGESHKNAILTDEKVKWIREQYLLGSTQKEIAEAIGCSCSNVAQIVRGERWTHV